MLTSNMKASLKATLDDVWGDQMKKKLAWESCGFTVSSTKDAYVDDQEYAGLGVAPIKPEGAQIALDDTQEGYSKRYTMVTTALRFVVSMEALADKKYDEPISKTKNLTNSLKMAQEYDAANVFIRAFNSSYTGGDGLELCSTAHLLPKGGTFSNEFSTPMSLSETAVETMIVNVGKIVSSNGYLLNGYNVKKLVVPRDLMFRAARILKSEKQNDTANNAINVLKGMGIEVVSNPYLTSTTNWFGITDAEPGLKFVWRERPKFYEHKVEDNLTTSYGGYQRYDLGWTDARGVYGSAI